MVKTKESGNLEQCHYPFSTFALNSQINLIINEEEIEKAIFVFSYWIFVNKQVFQNRLLFSSFQVFFYLSSWPFQYPLHHHHRTIQCKEFDFLVEVKSFDRFWGNSLYYNLIKQSMISLLCLTSNACFYKNKT